MHSCNQRTIKQYVIIKMSCSIKKGKTVFCKERRRRILSEEENQKH